MEVNVSMGVFSLTSATESATVAVAAASSNTEATASPVMTFLSNYSGFIIIIFFFAVMYFFIVRPQKKKDKETTEMRNSLEIGDKIVTIGGIVGKVVNVKDDTVIIETGSDRNRLTFLKSAIQSKTDAYDD